MMMNYMWKRKVDDACKSKCDSWFDIVGALYMVFSPMHQYSLVVSCMLSSVLQLHNNIFFFRSHWVLVVLTENVVVVMDSLLKTLPDSDRTKIDRLVGEMLRVMT